MESKLGRVDIHSHQKRTFLEKGIVFLGWEWEERTEATIEIEGVDWTFPGYTDDPEIVTATKEFIRLVDRGEVPDGER